MDVFEMIEAQQKGKENTAPWMVGEQLKDICRREPECAGIVAEDLKNKDMGIDACEKKIKAWADGHKKGNCAVVPPNVAEGIIREFYGLPGAIPQSPPVGGDSPLYTRGPLNGGASPRPMVLSIPTTPHSSKSRGRYKL